jgi:tRNA(fMet)-specific endonuclease VapC
MALNYLLDTNTLSEPMRRKPNLQVLARLQRSGEQIAVAATTWHELWFGLLRMPISAKRTAVEHFLLVVVQAGIPILPYDAVAAEWFAQERARLTLIGRTPSYPDGQIAAVAATNNLILVTRNTADFADFAGLRLENWFEPAA